MATNDRCDGAGPHTPGEVRKYPIGGGGNAILCKTCVKKENQFRLESRVYNGADPAAFQRYQWVTLEVYE